MKDQELSATCWWQQQANVWSVTELVYQSASSHRRHCSAGHCQSLAHHADWNSNIQNSK
jgi:hypothetical protein